MTKLRQVLIAIILTNFVLKIVKKLKHPDQFTKEQAYRAMCDARKQWLREHQPQRPVAEVDGKLMERDQSAALSSISQANLNLMGSCAR